MLTIRTRMLNSDERQSTKFEALFFNELHLKTMALDLESDNIPNYR